MTTDTKAGVSEYAHMLLKVADIDRSRSVYKDLLGFTPRSAKPLADGRPFGPFMEGLNGVIFVQAVHYFPFILINLSAALRNIDKAMEEAAQNLGSSGFRLFRRIVFPLAMPGYIAGASLVPRLRCFLDRE